MPARESRDGREYLIRCRRIVKLYDRWRKSCRAFNRDFAVFLFFFFFFLFYRILCLHFVFDNFQNYINLNFKFVSRESISRGFILFVAIDQD